MERPAHDAETGHPLAAAVLRPRPQRSVRPWAGHRLGADGDQVGELWLAGPDSVVETVRGSLTLDEVAAAAGTAFVGRNGMRLLGARFPLLVKLIDAAEWLSLQVHPDDALAAELYGPRALGKTEAWVILDADPDAELVTGPGPGLSADALLAAVAAGDLDRDRCHVEPCTPGETRLLRAGTLHAIGAGCFVYEIEQPSDLTFRISDWGRPETPDRPLHRAESARAVRPDARAELVGRGWQLDGGALSIPEFQLELVDGVGAGGRGHDRRPAGTSLEIVTAVRGQVEVSGEGWNESLATFETLVVPASMEAYRIQGAGEALACVGRIP